MSQIVWDRDRLLMELSEFSFGSCPEYSEISKYREFYQLRFDVGVALESRLGWLESDDFRLVLQTYSLEDAKGTVFVFHGYFDHGGIYRHLTEFLLTLGYSVVIYDMPGHGLSSGKRTSITRFDQYQDALQKVLDACEGHLPKPYHAVGQSTGAAVLIDRLSRKKPTSASDSNSAGLATTADFDKVIMLAPLVRPAGWKGIKLLHSAISPFFEVWRRTFAVNSTDIDFVDFLKTKDPLQSKILSVDWVGALKHWVLDIEARPPLNRRIAIVQGTSDNTVEWEHNVQVIRSLFEQAKVCYVEGGHHHLVNESPEIRNKVFSIIRSELGCS